jgi:glucosamine-6-phosphate deaminase
VGRIREFRVDNLAVEVYGDKQELGQAAAARAARFIADALAREGRARIIVGTGPSQNEVIRTLTESPLDWRRVEVFHMDEYVGIAASHPASFRRWLREHVVDRVHPGRVYYLEGDASDVAAECRRYAALLSEAPVDVCLAGFGENGHIAFNDPHEADFNDAEAVKAVTLDERCRAQQVGEGHFPDVAAVPARAVTLTCPALMAAQHVVCSVPDRRKADAVRRALEGPVTERCPASVLRTHADSALFLEPESAGALDRGGPGSI